MSRVETLAEVQLYKSDRQAHNIICQILRDGLNTARRLSLSSLVWSLVPITARVPVYFTVKPVQSNYVIKRCTAACSACTLYCTLSLRSSIDATLKYSTLGSQLSIAGFQLRTIWDREARGALMSAALRSDSLQHLPIVHSSHSHLYSIDEAFSYGMCRIVCVAAPEASIESCVCQSVSAAGRLLDTAHFCRRVRKFPRRSARHSARSFESADSGNHLAAYARSPETSRNSPLRFRSPLSLTFARTADWTMQPADTCFAE